MGWTPESVAEPDESTPPSEPGGWSRVRPGELPLPLSAFIGRADEITTVTALVRRPEIRLVTLTGPGGIGKTRLALQVGTAIRADAAGFGGVFFRRSRPEP